MFVEVAVFLGKTNFAGWLNSVLASVGVQKTDIDLLFFSCVFASFAAPTLVDKFGSVNIGLCELRCVCDLRLLRCLSLEARARMSSRPFFSQQFALASFAPVEPSAMVLTESAHPACFVFA